MARMMRIALKLQGDLLSLQQKRDWHSLTIVLKCSCKKNIICKCLSPGKPAMEWGEKPREWVTVILPLRSLVRYIEKCVWVSARYWKSLRWCSFIRTVENRTDFLLLDSLLIHALSFHNKNHCFSYFTSSCWRLRFLHLRNAASTGWVYRSF